MILYSLDKVICVRFILPAGFAEFSTSINTIFNQHRSTYYGSFCKSYNIFTEKFPNDLVLPVRVFIPLSFSGADNCTFLVGSPFLSFFFKKLNIFFTYFVSSFFYCFFNILDLFKLAVLKSLFCFFVSGLLLRYCLFSVIGGWCSFTNLNSNKVLFKLTFLPITKISCFYAISFSKDFERINFV